MKMDRVVLMVKIPDSNELRTKMSLFARRSMDPGELTIIETMDNIVTAALTEGRPLFTGDPLLEGGWSESCTQTVLTTTRSPSYLCRSEHLSGC
jgi:hypothetical protein